MSQVKRYHPSDRAAAKQAARDMQARALARGGRSAAQLHRETASSPSPASTSQSTSPAS
jgi:hypothetical protein